MFMDGQNVLLGRISFMLREIPFRVSHAVAFHDAVSCDFGHDGGEGDGVTKSIALDKWPGADGEIRWDLVAVNTSI